MEKAQADGAGESGNSISSSNAHRIANRPKAIALLISLYRHSQKETMENPVLIFVNFSTHFCSSFGRNIQSASKCIKKRPAQVFPRVGRFPLNWFRLFLLHRHGDELLAPLQECRNLVRFQRLGAHARQIVNLLAEQLRRLVLRVACRQSSSTNNLSYIIFVIQDI